MNKVKVTKKEFEKVLLSYDIGELVSFRRFKKGQANTNYLLNTYKGKYVCKIYNNKSKEEVLFGIGILNTLRKNNFPCIKFVSSKSNGFVQSIKNKPSIIYEFVEGRQVNKPNVSQFLLVARTMAKLHNIKLGFNKNSFSIKENTKSNCLEFAKESVKDLEDFDVAKKRLACFAKFTRSISDIKGVPKGIIHGDFSQENILFSGDEISAVIDFDGNLAGPFVFDIASLIYFWAWFKEPKRKLNIKKARSLLDEYQRVRKLNEKEKLFVYDALVLRTLVYWSWNICETEYEKELNGNYYEYFKQIVEQVTSIGRDNFYKSLFD